MIAFLERKRLFSFCLTLLIAFEIFYFSSLLGGSIEAPGIWGIWISRSYHFIVFFLFSFFLLATIKSKNKLKTSHLFTVFVISFVYAILDEIHQSFIPFRDPSIRDILTDNLGIMISLLIYTFIDWKKRKFKIR